MKINWVRSLSAVAWFVVNRVICGFICVRTHALLTETAFNHQFIYQATVRRNDNNTSETYIGLTKNAFKTRYSNHTASFRHTKHRNSTELSKHVWSLKDSNIDYSISLRIISSSSSYDSSSKRCNLSLKEEFLIICLPIYYHLTNVTNVYLLAATEIKRCCVTTKHLNLNFPEQCNLKVYSQWLWIFLSLKSPEEWAISKQTCRDESVFFFLFPIFIYDCLLFHYYVILPNKVKRTRKIRGRNTL